MSLGMNMKIMVFMWYYVVWQMGSTNFLEELQGWRQQVSTKYWYQCTKLNGITLQTAVI